MMTPAHKTTPEALTAEQLSWLEANGFTVYSALHRGFIFTRKSDVKVWGPKPGTRGLCADELELKDTEAMVYQGYPTEAYRISFRALDGSTAYSPALRGLKYCLKEAIKAG